MNKEKSSETEKRYAKHVGKLYWYKDSVWNYDKRVYINKYTLVMVASVHRPYYSNRFCFLIQELESRHDDEKPRDYNIQATRFMGDLDRGRIIAVGDNAERPPVTESESW